jgi:hypothetical protein
MLIWTLWVSVLILYRSAWTIIFHQNVIFDITDNASHLMKLLEGGSV